MTRPDQTRVDIFKRQLKTQGLDKIDLKTATDEELLSLLNSAVLPNAIDINAIQHTVFLHFIYSEKKERREKLRKKLASIIESVTYMDYSQKVLIKFGIMRGFLSSSWKNELHRYIQTPISDKLGGRKIISSFKFREIFFFAHNLITRGEKNGRFPRF